MTYFKSLKITDSAANQESVVLWHFIRQTDDGREVLCFTECPVLTGRLIYQIAEQRPVKTTSEVLSKDELIKLTQIVYSSRTRVHILRTRTRRRQWFKCNRTQGNANFCHQVMTQRKAFPASDWMLGKGMRPLTGGGQIRIYSSYAFNIAL